MCLSQCHYVLEILDRTGMTDRRPCSTPIDTNTKLSMDGPSITDTTYYRGVAGALQYLTFTRPNISYGVHQICLYLHDAHEPHLVLIKWALCYIRSTLDYGLQLHRSTGCDLVAYSDANWAGCPDTRRMLSFWAII